MFAVIETGGKQYRVAEGETVYVEKLEGAVGDSVNFDQVLMVGSGEDVTIGNPALGSASVSGEIVEHGKDKRLIVFKFKRRKDYKRKNGHRQHFTAVKITSVAAS